jgi:hypothetical protein
MLPVGRLFKLALWMQAAALASPIALMAYWSIEPLIIHSVCPAEICINVAPALLILAVLGFGAPLALVLLYAARRRALLSDDLVWLIGADAYALVFSLLGLLVLPVAPYDVMAAVLAVTTLFAAAYEVAWWRRKPADVYLE